MGAGMVSYATGYNPNTNNASLKNLFNEYVRQLTSFLGHLWYCVILHCDQDTTRPLAYSLPLIFLLSNVVLTRNM